MNRFSASNHRPLRSAGRRGISILEVIACTALVAVMLVPIAGVIRASGQAISQSDLDTSTEAQMRNGLRWLSDSIRDGSLLGVDKNGIKLTLKSGVDVKCEIVDGDLVMTDGTDQVVVVENVKEIQFDPIVQSLPPNALSGMNISLAAADPVSGKAVVINSMVSLASPY